MSVFLVKVILNRNERSVVLAFSQTHYQKVNRCEDLSANIEFLQNLSDMSPATQSWGNDFRVVFFPHLCNFVISLFWASTRFYPK
jgi:hypothetical protein